MLSYTEQKKSVLFLIGTITLAKKGLVGGKTESLDLVRDTVSVCGKCFSTSQRHRCSASAFRDLLRLAGDAVLLWRLSPIDKRLVNTYEEGRCRRSQVRGERTP